MKVQAHSINSPIYAPPAVSNDIAGYQGAAARPAAGHIDKATLSAQSSRGPANRVKVQKGDSLSQMLVDRGYSLKELLAKDENGKTMLDKVAAQNGLRNPNLIYPGQDLSLPNKNKTKAKEAGAAAKKAVRPQGGGKSLLTRLAESMIPGLKFQNMKVGQVDPKEIKIRG